MKILRTISAVIAALSLMLSTSLPAHPLEVWRGGDLVYFDQSTDGDRWGQWGIQYASTYDGDGIIAARVRDLFTDGSCVSAVYSDGGRNYVQGVSCGRWAYHRFYDQTGDSIAWVKMNRTRIDDPQHWKRITGF